MSDQRLLRIGGDRQRGTPHLARQMLHEGPGEARDVGLPVTQWRQPEDQRVNAIVQILPEGPSIYQMGQFAVRRRQEAHVHPPLADFSQPAESLFFDHLQ